MKGLRDGVGAVVETLHGAECGCDEGHSFLGGLGTEGSEEFSGERAFEWDEAEGVLRVVA